MLDRNLEPVVEKVDKIHLIEPKIFNINEHASLFLMDKVVDETARIELHFHAGSTVGEKNCASFVSSLLLSGTNKKNSKQIHEEINQLGAYVDHEISLEKAYLNIYCLRKNIDAVLEIVFDAVENLNFEEHEIHDVLIQKEQQLKVSLEKVSYIARKVFQKNIFYGNEQYTRQLELEDFKEVKREKLIEFHKKHYLNALTKIVVVSNIDVEKVQNIIQKFKKWAITETVDFPSTFNNNKGFFSIEKEGALQSAIRLGIPMFTKKHEDFIDFQILQTILGDYFGSRLMSNIREDKGYTYGIGCSLVEFNKAGYFVVATEVGKEVCQETIKEIKFEFDRLKEELIPLEELNLVKNYLTGQLLKSADGPNPMMDLFLSVYDHQLDLSFYDKYMYEINQITPQKIQEVAKKYLNWENFTIVTCG